MSGAKARLSKLASHLHSAAGSTDVTGSSPSNRQTHVHHLPLSPTQFLPRASAIEPDVCGARPQDRPDRGSPYLLLLPTGASNQPHNRRWQGPAPHVSRVCRPRARSGLPSPQKRAETSGYPLSEHTCFLGVDLRHSRRRRRFRRYAQLAQVSSLPRTCADLRSHQLSTTDFGRKTSNTSCNMQTLML